MSHGSNKNEFKGISFNKFKVIKFKREPNQSKPPRETQKGRSLFVFGTVKTKTTLEDSDKVSNVPNKTQQGESLFVCGNIKSKKTPEDCNKIANVPNKRRGGGDLEVGKWDNVYCVIKNWKQKRTNRNSGDRPTGISDNGAY